MTYLRPQQLQEAVAALQAGPAVLLAGGTDFFPARVVDMHDERVLDLSAIAALRGIEESAQGWRIGALVTWTELLLAALPPLFDGLKAAAREIGGPQVQNAGTLAGNLCNASPAADGVPCLLALDASVELAGPGGVRLLPVGEFVLGNRRIARAPDEIVTAILVPRPGRPARGTFLKLGARKYLVISIVMVAAVAEYGPDAEIAAIRIAVGAAGPRAVRLPDAEHAVPRGLDVLAEHLAPLSPIDDVRADALYRRDAALTLVRRAVAELRR